MAIPKSTSLLPVSLSERCQHHLALKKDNVCLGMTTTLCHTTTMTSAVLFIWTIEIRVIKKTKLLRLNNYTLVP